MGKTKTTAGRSATDKQRDTFSVDVYSGAPKLTSQQLHRRQHPENVGEAQAECRRWHESNWFVEQAVALRTMFFNYGLRLKAASGSKKDKDKLQGWLESDTVPEEGSQVTNREQLHGYIADVWNEANLMDSVVSMWLPGEVNGFPWVLKPEICQYTNAFGNEKLKVRLGVDKQQLKGSALTSQQVERYGASELTMENKGTDERFKVLTRGLRYHGFGTPRLRRCFLALGQMESMEVGENALAFGGRAVMRFHKLGFEVRSAAGALKQPDYLWSKVRHKAITDYMRGRQGFMETTGQFDQNISYVWVDPKFYDARKWETVINRLIWWGGPAAFLLIAKQAPMQLFQFLRAEAAQQRQLVGTYLEGCLNASGALPCAVRLAFGNQCFTDPRLAWAMAQGLLQAGPLSPQTALEAADFDPVAEAERKQEARKNEKHWTPIFDAAHGNRPGRPGGSKNGDAV